jgi:hypothetical protein
MNEWNPWETHLRFWTPRRPSDGLKERVFARFEAAGRERPWVPAWLAPVTVCLLLMFVTFNQRNGELARMAGSNREPVMALTLSNMSPAAYLPGSFVNDQNAVRPDTFEWTNQGHSPSSIHSFAQSQTNYLKR